jgi:dimethylaniline monooxygenase (N-oxide forming)
VFDRVGANGYPNDMLLTSELTGAIQKYCPSLVNWFAERTMNEKFNHQMYGLKPKHRPLG